MRVIGAILLGVQLISYSTGTSPKGSSKSLRTLIDSMRNPLAAEDKTEGMKNLDEEVRVHNQYNNLMDRAEELEAQTNWDHYKVPTGKKVKNG